MAEYINRENAIKMIQNDLSEVVYYKKEDAIDCLKCLPPADVVEVVRCKDCKYRNTRDCKMWYQCVICGDYHHWERDNYFCSFGEMKRDDNG